MEYQVKLEEQQPTESTAVDSSPPEGTNAENVVQPNKQK